MIMLNYGFTLIIVSELERGHEHGMPNAPTTTGLQA